MDSYKVVISERAESQLSDYIEYIYFTLLNDQAARSVYQDAVETWERLSNMAGSLKYCSHPVLRKKRIQVIPFKRHQYVMLYRVEGEIVYVEAIYHQKQDYEAAFVRSMLE